MLDSRLCLQIARGTTQVTMSIVVDEVSEVLDVAASQLEPTPEFGSSINTDFILAMGKVEDKVVMLLDADKVLSTREIETIHGATLKT